MANLSETRWNVVTLPRGDGIEYNLTLSVESDEPVVLAAIEEAAANAGMTIVRLAEAEEGET